ncbi:MAG: hypothetical protein GKS01_00715 [Alphaproteobacteria bacterium]|nr:hypothetical protein [Alphaproteobacteria bacterium]
MAIPALLVGISSAPNVTAANKIATPNFDISYANISDDLANRFGDDIEQTYRNISAYLGNKVSGKIIVSIKDDHFFPHYKIKTKTIAVPANRLRGDASGPPSLRGRGPGEAALVTNVLAISTNKKWAKFLDTGLEIFLQEKFGKEYDRAYPTMGKEIHKTTAATYRRYNQLFPLMEVEEVRTRRQRLVGVRQLAYLQEASFVKFLIEKHGKNKFFDVFYGKPFETTYGKKFGMLEQEWITLINSTRIR